MSKYTKLFEPTRIGKVELRNRIVMLPTSLGLAEKYRVSDKLRGFYAARSRGGVGLIIQGATYPADMEDTQALCRDNMMGIGAWTDDMIPGLRSLTDAVHAGGAKMAAQLALHYEWRPNKQSPFVPVGPGPDADMPGAGKPRALSIDEIHTIVEQFGDAARRIREAGYDICVFHAGMGYFINRFLSPYSNKRTDEYGGSMENRARILIEMIENAKKKAGADFTYMVRIAADEFMKGGHTLADTQKLVPILEKTGISGIDVQCGWHESPLPLVQQWLPSSAFSYLAEGVKKVTKLPVIYGYRNDNADKAEEILQKGQADLIGMARLVIADAEWPKKIQSGKPEDVRQCIVCCRCLDNIFSGIPIQCSVNAGLDIEPLKPAKEPKKVLVVGAGPSGMEAARIAALRGHKVTLMDKGPRVGGLLVLAQVLNDKLEPLVKWYSRQMKTLPIELRLGTSGKAEYIAREKPDVVIVAAGGEVVIPNVPGVKGPNVVSGNDIKNMMNGVRPRGGFMWSVAPFFAKMIGGNAGLMRKLMGMNWPLKSKVAIIGGQFAGCEMALTLMEKGKKVSIIDESKRLGSDIGIVTRWLELQMLKEGWYLVDGKKVNAAQGGVRMDTLTKVTEITGKGVKVTDKDGKEGFIESDSIMLTLPLKENLSLIKELEGKVPVVYGVGDASAAPTAVHRILEAISTGYEAGNKA